MLQALLCCSPPPKASQNVSTSRHGTRMRPSPWWKRPGSHLEISQKHPVQMLSTPQVAIIDAKKLQLINQIYAIKSLFFYLITHLEVMTTNYRERVLMT